MRMHDDPSAYLPIMTLGKRILRNGLIPGESDLKADQEHCRGAGAETAARRRGSDDASRTAFAGLVRLAALGGNKASEHYRKKREQCLVGVP